MKIGCQQSYKAWNVSLCLLVVLLTAIGSRGAFAAQTEIPGSADVNRMGTALPEKLRIEPAPPSLNDKIETGIRYSQPPANADKINLKLVDIKIEGVTAYTQSELQKIFAQDIGKNIPLSRIWEISNAITQKYRQDGYFLSRAYVPAQEIDNGKITIKVAEGYIKTVEIDKALLSHGIVKDIIKSITSEKPISSKKLEYYHLLLTDLSGLQNLYGTLAPIKNQRDGGVRLIYARNENQTKTGYVGVNNYGSKFLGPAQAVAQWQGNLIGVQDTSVAARTSLPFDELTVVNAAQTIPLTPTTALTLSAGVTKARPGFTLAPQDIESNSTDLGLNLSHKIVRQRLENWSVNAGIDGRNSRSTILGRSELSEDKVRALRFGTVYDTYDSLAGYNRLSVTFSKGLHMLGSSDANDLNVSRGGAKPNFSKVEASYLRYQALPYNISGLLSVHGQKASGSLYSSEEFGFGGQDMGRAYDSSELTGDDGVAMSVEFQYNNIQNIKDTVIKPYVFYDIGKIWNQNAGQVAEASASSSGAGIRFEHKSGVTGSLEVAVPLTKSVDTPIYGDDKTAPRLNLQIGYKF